ncbi:hypothetical protein TWF694_006278 [Orbilia ellipsospora]|uniref:Cytochrome b561 domain-containing protein n=1 Tax=Orbilia ellipsospora TaxID=2528407 RepID=A0AAV9XJL1_9PEZI
MRLTILFSLIFAFAFSSVATTQLHNKQSLHLRAPPTISHLDTPAFQITKRQNGPDSAAAEGGHGGRRTKKTTPAQRRNFRIAHGVIMGSAFTIGFPTGGIFIRVLKPPNHVYIHIFTQLFSTAMAFTGLGLGVWLGLNTRYLDYAHTIIGFAVVACLVIQPVIGAIHHWRYKKYKKPTWWGYAHRWFGRAIIVTGIVNGGIGLLLADNTKGGKIAYIAVAGTAGFVYLMVVVQWILRTRAVRKDKASMAMKRDYMESTDTAEPQEAAAHLMPTV